jgi:hypothetical protein
MVEDRKAIVGSVARGITSIEDALEGLNAVARATVWWTLETSHRDRARSQALWMVRQARRAARRGMRTMPAGGAIKRSAPCGT